MLVITIIIYIIIDNIFTPNIGNYINPIVYILLTILIFSLAYTFTSLSSFIKNDLSYGIYVYHMPIVNLFLYYGIINNILYEFILLSIVLAIAYLSWKYVEQPILSMKRKI